MSIKKSATTTSFDNNTTSGIIQYRLDRDGKRTAIGSTYSDYKSDVKDSPQEDGSAPPAEKSSTKSNKPTFEEKEVSVHNLEGEISIIINNKTLKPKIGETINLQGFGTYLSGNYYILSKRRELTTDGYTLVYNLQKQDFSDSLKKHK